MPLEKAIIKAQTAGSSTFEYRPKEITAEVSAPARSFVDTDAFRSNDFKISALVAEQAGISQLESDAHQDRINAQVLEKFKEVEERAYKEGYELGLIEGTEKAFHEAKASLLEKMRNLESMLKRMEDLKQQLLVENEAALIRLVYLTARKMAMRDLDENRGAVWEILQHVVGEVQASERVVVRISQVDMDFLSGLQEKSGQNIDSLQRVKFVVDENIKPGGCMIETDFGNVDATVEERVDRMWQTLLARIPQNAAKKE